MVERVKVTYRCQTVLTHLLFRITSFCLSSSSRDRLYAVMALSVWLRPWRICPSSLCAGAKDSLTERNPATYLQLVIINTFY